MQLIEEHFVKHKADYFARILILQLTTVNKMFENIKF